MGSEIKDKLISYLKAASKELGKQIDEEKSSEDKIVYKPAGYSLAWYYDNCIKADLDKNNPNRYSEVLDLYLEHADMRNSVTVDISEIGSADENDANSKLDNNFPQSNYPLNEKQKEAVHKALHYPLSIIWGPPGTGKTETIMRIAALAASKGERVAIVSTTNAAVENIRIKMESAFNGFENSGMSDLAYEAACKYAALGHSGWRKNKAVDAKGNKLLIFNSEDHEFGNGNSAGGWEKEITFKDFTNDYPIITCTVHSLKKCFKDGDAEKYDLLIMDEASQTNLIVGIVAMSCAKRIVLVGDEKQLPPVITDEHRAAIAQTPEYKDLFEKVNGCNPEFDLNCEDRSILSSCTKVFSEIYGDAITTMLKDHHRCHPAIIEFCNEYVYEGKLHIMTSDKNKAPCPIALLWYEGDYRENRWLLPPKSKKEIQAKSSVVNCKQAIILREEEASRLRDLVNEGKSICILSPFKAQIYLLKRIVEQILGSKGAVKLETVTDGDNDSESGNVTALTIHKSQGQEFDVVYLLPVEDGNWEWPWSQGYRLINVAVSRAKEELRVVLSTKLMRRNLQDKYALRHVDLKNPAKSEDDPENEKMFVQKLADYTDELLERPTYDNKKEKEKSEGFGFHKSIITSIFDELPWVQNPKKGKNVPSAPETCMEQALQNMDLDGLAYKSNVDFKHIFIAGKPLSVCANGFQDPDEAHFDFVVYDPSDLRIIMAIEVDGGFHRLKKNKDENKTPNRSVEENDETKDRVVKEKCNGALAHLGNHLEVEAEVVELGAESKQNWICSPEDLSEDFSFVFLRIPTSGVTFWETDALKNKARETDEKKFKAIKCPPPTIEDYIKKQRKILEKNNIPFVSIEEYLSITKCLKEWRKDPQLAFLLEGINPPDMNIKLVEQGYIYLENDNNRLRKPTKKGIEIGIIAGEGNDKDGHYVFPQYSQRARDYLAEHMEEIV